MSSIIIFPYWREGRGNPTLPPTPQSLKRALGFFGYLAEAGRLDLRFFLLLRQRLHGIVIYPRADNLRATKLGFWHQIAVEAKPTRSSGSRTTSSSSQQSSPWINSVMAPILVPWRFSYSPDPFLVSG